MAVLESKIQIFLLNPILLEALVWLKLDLLIWVIDLDESWFLKLASILWLMVVYPFFGFFVDHSVFKSQVFPFITPEYLFYQLIFPISRFEVFPVLSVLYKEVLLAVIRNVFLDYGQNGIVVLVAKWPVV